MKVLVGCEESQEVCKAFRALGHEAYSCDLLPCSGGHPEWHLQMDVFKAIELKNWSLGIFHPPCTKLSNAGARWLYGGGKINEQRLNEGLQAKRFFLSILSCGIKNIAVENPTPMKIFSLPKESQVIQPYQFGHPYSKRTLLWLKGVPKLTHTKLIADYKPFLPSNTGGGKRGTKPHFVSISQRESSKTFPGIAKAMAEQWGSLPL